MTHVVAALVVAALCIVWWLLQRALSAAGGDGRPLPGGCGSCERADDCAGAIDDDPGACRG